MTFKLQGKPVTQTDAVLTVAIRKLADGWRIAAWAWAKGAQDCGHNLPWEAPMILLTRS